jgi:hypothetical protein
MQSVAALEILTDRKRRQPRRENRHLGLEVRNCQQHVVPRPLLVRAEGTMNSICRSLNVPPERLVGGVKSLHGLRLCLRQHVLIMP